MSKQWGHGYYKGIEDAQANNGTLSGLWFHSLQCGKIEWQGRVARDLQDGNYVVQLFGWLTGNPTVRKVISFDQMKEWDFYPTDRDMRYAWNKHEGGSDEDFEWSEQCAAIEARRGDA